jgi:hypothetical protein
MADALETLLPLFLFMLIPVWIPVVTVTVATIADGLRRAGGTSPAPRARTRR